MLKKIFTGAIAGTCLMFMVNGATAEQVDMNIYGASAQFKYWTVAAPGYLTNPPELTDVDSDGVVTQADVAGGDVLNLGCSDDDVWVASTDGGDLPNGKDAGIAICLGSAGIDTDGDGVADVDVDGDGTPDTGDGMHKWDGTSYVGDGITYAVRYTANASYDGVNSVQGIGDTMPEYDDTTLGCADNERALADEASTDFVQYSAVTEEELEDDDTNGDVTDISCMDVHIGASDVAAKTFNQTSFGNIIGPKSDPMYDCSAFPEVAPEDYDGDCEYRVISGYDVPSDFLHYRPIVVPFSFFASNDVYQDRGITNMTRLMATTIFSGQVTNWDQFGANSLGMTVCLRHAGSGTHATLDAAVMRKDNVLLQQEITGFPVIMGFSPAVWFNAGSSDAYKCVSDSTGAVGYADSDKTKDGYWANRMTYMGADGLHDNIVNGIYDFWSAQWCYVDNKEPAPLGDPDLLSKSVDGFNEADEGLIFELMTYAADPANMPTKRAPYWAAQNEMKVEKDTDFAQPKFK